MQSFNPDYSSMRREVEGEVLFDECGTFQRVERPVGAQSPLPRMQGGGIVTRSFRAVAFILYLHKVTQFSSREIVG